MTFMAEQGIATEQGMSTVNQSGAKPLEESGLPLGIPKQIDVMASHHDHAGTARLALTTLLSQDKLVDTITINSATSQTVPVWKFTHDASSVLQMHMRTYADFFHMSSWTLHFKFEFRSNFQQVGQCLVVQHNIPERTFWYLIGKRSGSDSYAELYSDYKLMTLLPHTKVSMGEDVDVHATMNWNLAVEGCQSSYAGYSWPPGDGIKGFKNEIQRMGHIFVIAPIPMQIAQGVSPNMSVRIWSRLSNLKLSAYDPKDTVL